MSVEIDIDLRNYEVLVAHTKAGIPNISPKTVNDVTQIINRTMQNVIPVKTGKLKRSIRSDVIGDTGIVSTNSGYGLFVDEPTKPHIIRAKNTPYLRIPLPDGTIIFRKQVFHTGTKGAFFRRNTLIRSRDRIVERLEQITKEAIRT